MLKRLVRGALVGGALTLDQVLRPQARADLRTAPGVTDQVEDSYEGVVRAKGGGFQPAREVREDVWVSGAARAGETRRSAHEVRMDEAVARHGVEALARETRSSGRDPERDYFEPADMRPDAMAARYGPDWRDLL